MVLQSIRQQLDSLPTAERRIARIILDSDPATISNSSVGRLAAASDASTATVVRLARRLGFEGFTALKLALAHEAGRDSAFGHAPSDPSDTGGSLLERVITDEVGALRHLAETVDTNIFERVVTLLTDATEIMFFGAGTSAHLAQLAAYRFNAVGKPAIAIDDPLGQRVRINTLRSDAVVVAISHTGATDSTCLTAEHAVEAGLTAIAITTTERSPLTEIATIRLVTGNENVSHHLDNFASRTVHVALLAALHQATAERLSSATEAGKRAATTVAQDQR